MALEIIQRRWCDGLKGNGAGDFVPRHDPQVEGSPRLKLLDGKTVKLVDLCDPCDAGDDMTVAELRATIREYGINADAPSAGRTPKPRGGGESAVPGLKLNETRTDCIWCPGNYSWGSWGGHLREIHGFSGVREALGDQCPACGVQQKGLSVHITRGHDEFATVMDAFFWARDNGDPYGVWAATLARGKRLDAAPDDVETLL